MIQNKNIFLDDLQEANQALRDDFHRARVTVQSLDSEKDRLSNEIDAKSELNLHLTQELNTKTRQLEEFNLNISEFQMALE